MAPHKPALPSSPITPSTSFLKTTWPEPTKIIDVTTLGATADDGVDDTTAIQTAIDAAAKAADGTMV